MKKPKELKKKIHFSIRLPTSFQGSILSKDYFILLWNLDLEL